jgi:hypothetical protein
MKGDQNTILLVVALALAIASGVLGVLAKAWAIVLVAVATVVIAAVLLF